jgi:hypothetical protein
MTEAVIDFSIASAAVKIEENGNQFPKIRGPACEESLKKIFVARNPCQPQGPAYGLGLVI